MKIFAVQASPKLHGNTSMLLDEYLKCINDNNIEHTITKVTLSKQDIQYCTGCCTCKTNSITNCTINDDMNTLYSLFEDADIVIFATPIFFYGPTALLKTFLERLYAIKEEAWHDKKIISITTYGSKNEILSGANNWYNMLTHLASDHKIPIIQQYQLSTGSVLSHKQNLDPKVKNDILMLVNSLIEDYYR